MSKLEAIHFVDKTGAKILIRSYVHKKDRDRLINMYLNYNPDDRCLGLPPITREAIEKWIDYLASSGYSIIAEHNGKIIGHLTVVPDGRVVDMSIYITREYQNRGIGTKMIQLIIEYCKNRRYDKITLVTERCNPRSIHVYKKCGFRTAFKGFEYEMELPLNGN